MSFRPVLQRLVPYLTVYLFLVSVGLPLQRVYCACVGEQWLAVLPETHECHHETKADTQSVHHHDGEACCAASPGAGEVVCTSHECGNTEVVLAQLHAKFTVDPATVDLGLRAVLPPAAFVSWPPKPAVARVQTGFGPAPPPLPGGRGLLVAYQTFLI